MSDDNQAAKDVRATFAAFGPEVKARVAEKLQSNRLVTADEITSLRSELASLRERVVVLQKALDDRYEADQRDVITRDKDIILQALAEYDAWMLDDDYDATTALHFIMMRVRDRALATN